MGPLAPFGKEKKLAPSHSFYPRHCSFPARPLSSSSSSSSASRRWEYQPFPPGYPSMRRIILIALSRSVGRPVDFFEGRTEKLSEGNLWEKLSSVQIARPLTSIIFSNPTCTRSVCVVSTINLRGYAVISQISAGYTTLT